MTMIAPLSASLHTATFTLDDLRPAFGFASRSSETPPAGALAALVSFWERCLRAEAESTPGAGFRYPAAYESAFDRAGDQPVAFVDLPIGLQRVLGGGVTDVWYALAEAGGQRETPAVVRRLVSSTWTRRTVPVQSLTATVLSAWAVHHVWPCGVTGYGDFGIPPIEFTGGYTRLLSQQRAEAPIIFLDGEIHLHTVAYLLAVLRFAPDAFVRVLDGRTDATADVATPIAPRWDWRADGSGLWDPSAPDGHDYASDALGAVDRMILSGHAGTIASVWTALGISRASGAELAAGLEAAVLSARLPYAEAPDGAAPSADSAYTAAPPQRRSWLTRVAATLQRYREGAGSGTAAALEATAVARAAVLRDRATSSPLSPFLPELRAAA